MFVFIYIYIYIYIYASGILTAAPNNREIGPPTKYLKPKP